MFEKIDDSTPVEAEEHPQFTERYYEPPMPPPQRMYSSYQMNDLNDNKNIYISLFIAFIIGFFMGKTLQPIIIKSS